MFLLPTAISTLDTHLGLSGNLEVLVKEQQGRGTRLQTAESLDFKITPMKCSKTIEILACIKAHFSLWKTLAFATYYTQYQKYSLKTYSQPASHIALFNIACKHSKGRFMVARNTISIRTTQLSQLFSAISTSHTNCSLTNRLGSTASLLGSITQRNSHHSNAWIKENHSSKKNPYAVTPCI